MRQATTREGAIVSTDTATESTRVRPDPKDGLRLVVSRTDEGIQLRLLGPAQLAAVQRAALPPPDGIHPTLRGSYFIG